MSDGGTSAAQQFGQKFLARVVAPVGLDVLFDYLPDIYFFVKDAEGRFVRVNRAFLQLVGAPSEDVVVGGTDSDFFPPNLAEAYARDDKAILATKQPLIDKAELMRNPDGSIDWYCTTKLPLFDKTQAAIGICGITRDVKKMNNTNAHFLSWLPVIETMLNDYAETVETAMLAQKVALSVSQFNRQFRRRFHTTPRAYLTNVRLNAACHLLLTTDLSMSQIALKTGFYDQSHFTNQFAKYRGMPPSKYRAVHGKSPALSLASGNEPVLRA
jgi:PAS domain S-box-containing protein